MFAFVARSFVGLAVLVRTTVMAGCQPGSETDSGAGSDESGSQPETAGDDAERPDGQTCGTTSSARDSNPSSSTTLGSGSRSTPEVGSDRVRTEGRIRVQRSAGPP